MRIWKIEISWVLRNTPQISFADGLLHRFHEIQLSTLLIFVVRMNIRIASRISLRVAVPIPRRKTLTSRFSSGGGGGGGYGYM